MDATRLLLMLHIAGGGLALVLGTLTLVDRKGGLRHRLIGRIYTGAMLTSAMVSLPLALLKSNYFLALIGIFTIYMLGSGWRAIRRRERRGATAPDWILTGGMAVFGLLLAVLGIRTLSGENAFGVVLLVFAGVSLAFVVQDWRAFRGESPVANWGLTTHLQRMLGSYIASVTAFLVVNNTMLPGVVAWLLPTVIVTPLIVRWSRKWGRPVKA